MSGIIAVYSLVISVLIAGDLNAPSVESYSLFAYDPFFLLALYQLMLSAVHSRT